MTKNSSPDFWFDEEEADRACEFFKRFLRHSKGQWAGQPLELSDWQRDDIIRPMFGWKRKDGTRKYRRVYIEIPRKNGKSTLSAGIALYMLFCDREAGAEIYSAAADRDQARIVFDVAKSMVYGHKKLDGIAAVFKNSIAISKSEAVYRVLSADAGTKHGLNAHGIIFDELHTQKNRELWDVLTTSTGSRKQPLIVAITTSGWDKHSICYEMHDYASKVRDGIIEDPYFLPVIYAAGESDDWTKPEIWHKANPGLGISVSEEYLSQECKRAVEVPGYTNTFKRLHLCIWTEAESRWLDSVAWEECALPVDAEKLEGRECYAGLDLSTTTDISALVLVFPDDDGGYDALSYFWVPEENIRKRSERDKVPYDVWKRQGHIEATPGNVVDYDYIQHKIRELSKKFNIREIAYDRWNSSQLVNNLMAENAPMVEFGQGFASMSAPSKELEKIVTGRQLRHGANPVLTWMANNVVVQEDPAGNLKPAKNKSVERIDGIVALIMALGRATVSTEPVKSIWETEGAFVEW